MEIVAKIILWSHILFGFTAFLVAPGALVTRKGGKWHRTWGKIFFWGMAGVAISALILTAIRPNIFLTLVAVFSFYSALSGYRVLYQKRPDRGQTPRWFDWMAAGITLLAGTGLVYLGFFQFGTLSFDFQPIMLVFGIIGLSLAVTDMRRFAKPFNPQTDRYNWYFVHIGNMLGAYIAAVTAFSAVNLYFLPTLLRWLWPTLIGTPLIFYWVRKYEKKFGVRRYKSVSIAENEG